MGGVRASIVPCLIGVMQLHWREENVTKCEKETVNERRADRQN